MEPRTTNPESRLSDRRGVTQSHRDPQAHDQRRTFRTTADFPSVLRELEAQGFTSTEAGNLAAYLFGLARTDDGWTIEQIERLLFVRHLVARRRMWS
jgi:hypothetical protein